MDETPSTLDLGFRRDDFRRLDVMSKAREVVEIAMLAHGGLLLLRGGIAARNE